MLPPQHCIFLLFWTCYFLSFCDLPTSCHLEILPLCNGICQIFRQICLAIKSKLLMFKNYNHQTRHCPGKFLDDTMRGPGKILDDTKRGPGQTCTASWCLKSSIIRENTANTHGFRQSQQTPENYRCWSYKIMLSENTEKKSSGYHASQQKTLEEIPRPLWKSPRCLEKPLLSYCFIENCMH